MDTENNIMAKIEDGMLGFYGHDAESMFDPEKQIINKIIKTLDEVDDGIKELKSEHGTSENKENDDIHELSQNATKDAYDSDWDKLEFERKRYNDEMRLSAADIKMSAYERELPLKRKKLEESFTQALNMYNRFIPILEGHIQMLRISENKAMEAAGLIEDDEIAMPEGDSISTRMDAYVHTDRDLSYMPKTLNELFNKILKEFEVLMKLVFYVEDRIKVTDRNIYHSDTIGHLPITGSIVSILNGIPNDRGIVTVISGRGRNTIYGVIKNSGDMVFCALENIKVIGYSTKFLEAMDDIWKTDADALNN